ncbi:TetR/AcrR family transcriptional regulator [Pseudooceanicola sediminis]|uniref:TetR/AcrR family transcriptional regulator n=1 Tax=Pseudooceanicola sediminis TaxID=2211117 RepID=A0A399J3J9_9RHOB|nr:TetR/AcrR family transcriptional regulator [Pseudooceanicola sediminis]KAA2314239.1 TetR/AcrR family transcriptional regulator [Puniceibacterium sp. HSS470]RII39904.1 TetR/AcrR family transcriptional regulator [Pseudooceanicola sediminis]|tara:strand:+ start:55453 stop:56688 length:1236 start_codon:yes stop_codon:yes gene_type:complete
MDDTFTASSTDNSDRFLRKRDEIVAAAAVQIAQRGLKGLTLVGVAQMVGLNTTSITYYFKRKELLAAAAVQDALNRFAAILLPEADLDADPRTYLAGVLSRNSAYYAAIRRGEAAPLTILSDTRALEEPDRTRLISDYFRLVAQVSTRFGIATDSAEKARNIARGQLLCDILHWSRSWLELYAEADLPRVQARLLDLLTHGFARPGATWQPKVFPIDPEGPAPAAISADTYLRTATRLINERGYRGASVERIVAQLQVSKGSFYHHLSGKDDLVTACFDRSYSRVSAAQHHAIALPGDQWHRLTSALASLLEVQVAGHLPLLRDTAMLALPPDMRPHVVRRSDRLARRFAGMISDGIAEGSIRPVDPTIAAQCLMGMVNSAADMASRAGRWPSAQAAIRDYAGPLAFGFFD